MTIVYSAATAAAAVYSSSSASQPSSLWRTPQVKRCSPFLLLLLFLSSYSVAPITHVCDARSPVMNPRLFWAGNIPSRFGVRAHFSQQIDTL